MLNDSIRCSSDLTTQKIGTFAFIFSKCTQRAGNTNLLGFNGWRENNPTEPPPSSASEMNGIMTLAPPISIQSPFSLAPC